MKNLPKLGLIAGSGDLPNKVIASCRESGRDFFVLAIEGETDKELVKGIPHEWVRLGAVSNSINILKQNEVVELVLAGKVNRPPLSQLRPDFGAARLLARIGASKLTGDNAILSVVVNYLEENGFKVVGVDSVISDIITGVGVIGLNAPNEQDSSDIVIGVGIARKIGELDIGQAVIVQAGRIIAVEGAEGTDAMIERSASLLKDGGGGVLVKMKKPGQEARVDLPTIGIHTLERCKHAGLSGIALEAGGSIIIDKQKIASYADEFGLFIIGVEIGSEV